MTTGRLSIELLEAFITVAKTNNITRAGEILNRTQPCISTQIKRLEGRVGRPLFERSSRSIRLTQTGRILLENAQNILQCYETARLRLSVPELTGKIHIGLPEWFATDGLQSVFCNVLRAHSNLKLDITIANSKTLHEMLSNGDINMAIALASDARPTPIEAVEEPLVWVTNQDNNIDDVVPLVLFEPSCPFRDIIFEALATKNRLWQERLSTTSVSVAQMAVSSGVGVSALPVSAVLPNHKILRETDGFPQLPTVKLAIYVLPDNQSEALAFFCEHLKDFLHHSVIRTSPLSKNSQFSRPNLHLV